MWGQTKCLKHVVIVIILSPISIVRYFESFYFHATPPSRWSEFIPSILCDKIDDPAGQINCIKGLCETCGELALFPLEIENIDVTKKLNCKSYMYVKKETKLGKETKMLEYVEEELPIV